MKTQKQQKEVHVYKLETSAVYNPFFLMKDGLCEGEVSTVKFFKEENGVVDIVASCRWFTIKRGKCVKPSHIGSNNDFLALDLPYSDIPYRKKESFGKDSAFYMKTPNKYGNGSLLELYLDISELSGFRIEKSEQEILYNGCEIYDCDIVTFDVKCVSRRVEWDGAKECVRTACFTSNPRHRRTDFGVMCEKIAAVIGNGISAYTVAGLIEKGAMEQAIGIYNEYRKTVS